MRKTLTFVCLLLIVSLLTSCTRQPDLAGRWETAPEETLCATVLWLDGDGSFTHLQEGRTITGTWALKGDRLVLTITPMHEADSGGMLTLTLNRPTGTLLTPDGLHLHRQPDPDVIGYWVSTEDDTPGAASLHLMESGYFTQEVSHSDAIDLTVLDGSDRLDGNWSLEGRLLTLRCSDKTVLRYRLSLDGTVITTDSGVQLTRLWQPD